MSNHNEIRLKGKEDEENKEQERKREMRGKNKETKQTNKPEIKQKSKTKGSAATCMSEVGTKLSGAWALGILW